MVVPLPVSKDLVWYAEVQSTKPKVVHSQASVVGSIPIARSKNPVDAVGLTGFPPLKATSNCSILDVVGRENQLEKGFGRDKIGIDWGTRDAIKLHQFRSA